MGSGECDEWRQAQRRSEESQLPHMVWLLPENLGTNSSMMAAIGHSPLVEREVLAALGVVAEERSLLPHLLVAYW